jgi:hypothetical protein
MVTATATEPKYRLRELVEVDCPDGTRPLGRIFGYEPGPDLRRWGGPFPTWAYHVHLVGVDGRSAEVVVPQENVHAIAHELDLS